VSSFQGENLTPETTTTTPTSAKRQTNLKDSEQSIDDLRMNLGSFAVQGKCFVYLQ